MARNKGKFGSSGRPGYRSKSRRNWDRSPEKDQLVSALNDSTGSSRVGDTASAIAVGMGLSTPNRQTVRGARDQKPEGGGD